MALLQWYTGAMTVDTASLKTKIDLCRTGMRRPAGLFERRKFSKRGLNNRGSTNIMQQSPRRARAFQESEKIQKALDKIEMTW